MKRFITLPVVALVSFMSLPSQAGLIAAWTFDTENNDTPNGIDPSFSNDMPPFLYTSNDPFSRVGGEGNEGSNLNNPGTEPTYSLVTGFGGNFTISMSGAQGFPAFVITYAAKDGVLGGGAPIQDWQWSTTGLEDDWHGIALQPPSATGSDGWYLNTLTFNAALMGEANQLFFQNSVTGGSIGIDNLQITAVPEPITYALAGFGVCVGGVSLGRRLIRGRARS